MASHPAWLGKNGDLARTQRSQTEEASPLAENAMPLAAGPCYCKAAFSFADSGFSGSKR
jgi:hypothetical protein